MARQLPGDSYTICEKKWKALIWRECRICRVNFKWEPFYSVYSDRDLKFPSESDREKKIVRYFSYTQAQTVCVHCAKQFGIDKIATVATPHEEFDALVDKMHAGEQPPPVHDASVGKVGIKAKGF